MLQNNQVYIRYCVIFSDIFSITSFEISVVPFSPLKMAKYEMAVRAKADQNAPMYLKLFL